MSYQAIFVKRWRNLGFVALLSMTGAAAFSTAPVFAADGPVPDSQQQSSSLNPQNFMPDPPFVKAKAWVLMDAKSGNVIYQHDEHEHLPPASLTKLMTAYTAEYEMAAGRLNMDDKATVSENAWRTGGSRMFLKPHTQVSIGDLLHGLIVVSGNDAAVAIAEHIAGSEQSFAQLMNEHAQMLGLKDTHYENPTGLPVENHYTSAYDLAELSRHIIYDFPQNYKIYADKHFTYNNIKQPNRVLPLWRDSRVDGLKTGFTKAAGYCMVISGHQNGTRLIAVVMGTDSEAARSREAEKLINYGLRYYHTRKLFNKGQVVENARVWGGADSTVPVGFDDDVNVTLAQNQQSDLSQRVELKSNIEAPIKQGDVLGKLTVLHKDKVITTHDIVALKSDDQGGFIRRGWDSIVRTVTGWI